MQSTLGKLSLGRYSSAVQRALGEAQEANAIARIWEKDPTLWRSDPAEQRVISNSLGWLTVADEMKAAVADLQHFAKRVRDDGFKHVMVCGMGGSSLCPEVLAQTFGPQTGFPRLLVLDSTDPDVIANFQSQIDIERCLFVIASKSGTTTEPLVFYRYWFAQVSERVLNAGESFVLITDPGSPLVDEVTQKKFRRVFLNQPTIGGRYSALSYFGMVPAALMGLNVDRLLDSAHSMSAFCGPKTPPTNNPSAVLGAVMAECAKAGRDKLTLITDREISSLGLWIEQLVAESTGKEGTGILPVNGEEIGPPEVYSNDRLFIYLSVGEPDPQILSSLEALSSAGHPVVHRTLDDLYDLGAEFFLWEFATAFAGWRLGINPFDQPNVQESKDATRRLLQEFTDKGELPEPAPLITEGVLKIFASDRSRSLLSTDSVLDTLRTHLSSAQPGDYLALLNYVEETPAIEATIQSIRMYLRDRTRCATTTGYGPRFLHSTGQLHKGGPDSGVFIQITAPDETDLPIPGEPYSFSVLKQAQALGDFEALNAKGRRAIRVELGEETLAGLTRLEELIVAAMS